MSFNQSFGLPEAIVRGIENLRVTIFLIIIIPEKQFTHTKNVCCTFLCTGRARVTHYGSGTSRTPKTNDPQV